MLMTNFPTALHPQVQNKPDLMMTVNPVMMAGEEIYRQSLIIEE